jgi:hypothetical protein
VETNRAIDVFVWQYASYGHLVYRRAPAADAHLSDLAQVMYALRWHSDPKDVAEQVLATWPFEASLPDGE